jgi:hypothetical protein
MILLVFLSGCAWIPVRPALQEDITKPAGKVEGNHFTGIRYTFNVSVPPNWKLTTEFPDFFEELGYDKPFSTDKEQTELYAYNPETKSNINFDFTPADRYSRFNQKRIELFTSLGTESLKAELDKEFGKGVVKPEIYPTEPITLKGVQYAAKNMRPIQQKGRSGSRDGFMGLQNPIKFLLFIPYLRGRVSTTVRT